MPDATFPGWVTAPLVVPLRSVELSAAAEAEVFYKDPCSCCFLK